MELTSSLECEANRQIALCRYSNMRVFLMSISAPQLSTAALGAAVSAAADPTDLVGSLPDGSIGVVSLQTMRSGSVLTYEQRFLTHLRARLLANSGGNAIGHVSIRRIERWAAELTDASELFDLLVDAPRSTLTVGIPVPPAAEKRRALRGAGAWSEPPSGMRAPAVRTSIRSPLPSFGLSARPS